MIVCKLLNSSGMLVSQIVFKKLVHANNLARSHGENHRSSYVIEDGKIVAVYRDGKAQPLL